MILLEADRNSTAMLVRLYKLSPNDKVHVDGCSRPVLVKDGISFMGIKNYEEVCCVVGQQLIVDNRALYINPTKCSTHVTYKDALAMYNLRIRPAH